MVSLLFSILKSTVNVKKKFDLKTGFLEYPETTRRYAPNKYCLIIRDSRGGGWSTDGCLLASSDNDTVRCECNHLTNFAVLVDTTSISSVSKIVLERFSNDCRK